MSIKSAIFVAYHKPSPIYQSEVFLPIHVGAAESKVELETLRDDTGENISVKNPMYCELTGLYWIWKNYLPLHPEIDRIGLCHYRRFLNPLSSPGSTAPFRPETFRQFSAIFQAWDSSAVDIALHRADVTLPVATDLRRSWLYDRRHETVYSQLARGDHKTELDSVISLISKQTDASREAVRTVFLGHRFHSCLSFVMRADLFRSFSEWLFHLLEEMENHPDAEARNAFFKPRTAGYLAERLFDVWLFIQNITAIRECDSLQLVDAPSAPLTKLRLIARHFRHPVTDARLIPLPPALKMRS